MPETYLGQKGYSIAKSSLTIEEQQYLRRELTVRPFIPGSPVQSPEFTVYKESPKKLYIPKFLGQKLYGVPQSIKIDEGEDKEIKFKGELRDYQINIIDCVMKNINKGNLGGLLEIPCGRGKTVLALHIISLLKKKTLVIVHKGFLLNQWCERISQFLPDCKVGKIQGQIIDCQDKDIVIGMLQSLSMKEYPSDLFNQFGLTIVDECHHISSEVFSQSLSKVITKYTLGLSATMERKDGLTKVFKWFLGDVLYKDTIKLDHSVEVKAIEYISNDAEFNETELDYRGNPAFSKMITKLCTFSYRTEFILGILRSELEKNKDQQILILGQNKSILKYLYNNIQHNKIATVGYYLGGMKQEALKKSESCNIIIATYAMAAEGLDIKTLTTLFMVTPRTDIIQAVGRILRQKHKQPLIIDVIDTHDCFKKQWSKRLSYYRKCDYTVHYYKGDAYYNNNKTDLTNKKKSTIHKKPKCLIKI